MNYIEERLNLLNLLGNYMLSNEPEWLAAKRKAFMHNPWFIPAFIEKAVENIVHNYLQETYLQEWWHYYEPLTTIQPKTVGLVMAGNIPLVGFHDFLCVFVSGHKMKIKLSSKDEILLKHLIEKLYEWHPQLKSEILCAERLNGCDAYIATGSNNTARYFEYYFSKYPHLIRKHRTSVAVLDGTETQEQINGLLNDVHLYFGLGCRNVTKLYVPSNYNFTTLLSSFNAYDYLLEWPKYKHNFDYYLTILIMNQQPYLNSGNTILTENISLFSPVSQLYYEYYELHGKKEVYKMLQENEAVQCVVGNESIEFGTAQQPGLFDYADGIDTMKFLLNL
jgi:hypothetical protein